MSHIQRVFKYILTLLILGIVCLSSAFAQAAPTRNPPTAPAGGGEAQVSIVRLENPIQSDTFGQLLGNIIDILLLLAAPVLVCVFIWIGLLFVLAQGNASKLKEARSALIWTIVGAAIVIGAKGIQILVTGTIDSIVN
jgi:hypothetical protein